MNKLLLSLLLVRTLGWCQDPVEAVPASPPKPDPVFKVGSGVSAPTLLYKVEPQYTEEARQARIEGTVFLFVEVNPEGRAVNPRVLRGVGYGLDEKALEAVAQWKFRPGAKDGKPVTVAATIEVNFRLLKNSDIAPPTTAPVVDPQLHANLVKLFELSGDRERIESALPQVLKDAGAKMQQVLPGSDPAYFEEWAKRMASRLNVQDLIDEEVLVYERHFTNDEISELLAVQVARKESKPAEVSTQLRQKIASESPAIQREINAGRQELFARVGSQIPDEIFKEHPEYKLRKPVAPPSPPPGWRSPEEADITYRTLVDRARGGDFSVDFRVLRLACVKSNLCQPRSTPQELSEGQRATSEHQLKQAIEFAERLIDRGFVNFEAHAECSGLYRKAGDEPKAIFHLQVATALAGSILATGDGKSKETAFEVISDREEYVVLASLGFPYAGSDVLSNSRITDGGHNYDKWSVRKPKTNEVVDVFFNTDYFSPTKSRAQP